MELQKKIKKDRSNKFFIRLIITANIINLKLCKRVVEFCKPSNLINTNSYLRPMQQKTWKWNLAQNIELRWWKNYLQDKNPTEYLVWKKEYWNNLLAQINDLKFENAILVGNEFENAKNSSAQFLCFKNVEELKIWFVKSNFSKHTFLLKGSRGMTLEKILE